MKKGSNQKPMSFNKKGMGKTTHTPMNIPIPAAKKEEGLDNTNDKHGKFKIKK